MISSVDLSGADEHGAGRKTAEIRRYGARGGASSVLARQTFGEESNLFGQVGQDDRFAWTVRTGIHQANAFVRIPLGSGERQEVRAFRTLGAGFAHTPDEGSLYVEMQDDGSVPSRIVAAPADPFGSTVHALTPELTVGYGGTPRLGGPLGVLRRADPADRGGRRAAPGRSGGRRVRRPARTRGPEPRALRGDRPHRHDRRGRHVGDHAPVAAGITLVHGRRGHRRAWA